MWLDLRTLKMLTHKGRETRIPDGSTIVSKWLSRRAVQRLPSRTSGEGMAPQEWKARLEADHGGHFQAG